MIDHLKTHEESSYLPPQFLASRRFASPRNRISKLQIMAEWREKGRNASHDYLFAILKMSHLEMNFSPVKVFMGNRTIESNFSDYYRNLALFNSFLDFDWSLLHEKSETSKYYVERVLKFGNSGENTVFRYFKKESLPHHSYEKLEYFHRQGKAL